jgi:diacylglycerol kinase family enzyme
VSAVRTAVVVNPARVSDVDDVRRRIEKALSTLDCPAPLWWETTVDDPGHGQTRAAVAAGAEVVFACGGDGTVRVCADELAGSPVALAVVPAGTGNLFAANLDLPSDVEECVATAVTGRRRRIDLGQLDGHHFVLMAGMGFDAAMMDSTAEWWKRRVGWPAYVVGGARRLFDPPMRLRIRFDGRPPVTRTARMVLVANLGRLQGGVDLFGDASAQDGQLDVVVVAPRRPVEWLRLVASVLRHRTPGPRQVETHRVSTVDIFSRTVEPREVDGDTIEPGRSLRVSVRPRALWVCVP